MLGFQLSQPFRMRNELIAEHLRTAEERREKIRLRRGNFSERGSRWGFGKQFKEVRAALRVGRGPDGLGDNGIFHHNILGPPASRRQVAISPARHRRCQAGNQTYSLCFAR